MTDLSINMNADGLVSAINGNLQDDAVSVGDSATDVCEVLNEAFDGLDGVDTLSPTMTGEEFVTAANKDFGVMEEGGELAPLEPLKFLHYSDTHGSLNSMDAAVNLMDDGTDVAFVAFTGDMSPYSSYEQAKLDGYAQNGKKVLYTQGNHCACELCKALDTDNSNGKYGKYILRHKAENWMSPMGVTWGNTENDTFEYDGEQRSMPRGIYWSKDITLSDGKRKLRVIGVDQYDKDQESSASYSHNISLRQVSWFINQLMSLGKNDFFLIALHEPPLQRLINLTQFRRQNSFCSSRVYTISTSTTSNDYLVSIVKAYLDKQETTIAAVSGVAPQVSVDFTGVKPATCVGWFCGHLHGELLIHHPMDGRQLISSVDTARSSSIDSSSDIRYSNGIPDDSGTGRPNASLINKVTIDFDAKTLTIERIGMSETAHHVVGSGYNTASIDAGEAHAAGYDYDAVENRLAGATYNERGNLVRDSITVPFAQEGGAS